MVPTETQRESGKGTAKPSLRADFARELETRLTGWVGKPGSEKFESLKPVVTPYMKDAPQVAESRSLGATFDISKLPEQAKNDLLRLQSAAEGIEAIFVKKLLGQMRSVTFSTEGSGPMADFAKDMMDQTIADQASKGKSSLGIARMIFLDSAQPMVRAAIARPRENQLEKK